MVRTKAEIEKENAELHERIHQHNLAYYELEKNRSQLQEAFDKLKTENDKLNDAIKTVISPFVTSIINDEIQKKLRIELGADYGGSIDFKLCWDGKPISTDYATVCTNYNSLEE